MSWKSRFGIFRVLIQFNHTDQWHFERSLSKEFFAVFIKFYANSSVLQQRARNKIQRYINHDSWTLNWAIARVKETSEREKKRMKKTRNIHFEFILNVSQFFACRLPFELALHFMRHTALRASTMLQSRSWIKEICTVTSVSDIGPSLPSFFPNSLLFFFQSDSLLEQFFIRVYITLKLFFPLLMTMESIWINVHERSEEEEKTVNQIRNNEYLWSKLLSQTWILILVLLMIL